MQKTFCGLKPCAIRTSQFESPFEWENLNGITRRGTQMLNEDIGINSIIINRIKLNFDAN